MIVSNENEIWKDIKTIPYHQAEWPFHQVSNFGRVRVLPGGKVGQGRLVTETELRILTRNKNGYMAIERWDDNGRHRFYAHVLVLNQFLGPCPPGQECRHLNGNPSDNRWPENIAWGTPKDNQHDRIFHGTDNGGERNGRVKLSQSQVNDIKVREWYPHINIDLAKEFGVSSYTIRDIRQGLTWR